MSDDIYIMKANPGIIQHHIKPEFDFPRRKEIKRTSIFRDTVHHIEDLMINR